MFAAMPLKPWAGTPSPTIFAFRASSATTGPNHLEGPADIQAIEMLRMLARFGGLAPVEERAHHFLESVPIELKRIAARLSHHLDKARSATRLALSARARPSVTRVT